MRILQDNNVVNFLGAPMITKLIYFLMFAKPPVIKRSIQTFGLCFSVVIVLGSEGRGGNVYLLGGVGIARVVPVSPAGRALMQGPRSSLQST